MKTYRHLFFDLDHTLWDFEANATETLHQLFHDYDLARHGTFTLPQFTQRYNEVNHALWRLYQANKISQQQLREVRFHLCHSSQASEAARYIAPQDLDI